MYADFFINVKICINFDRKFLLLKKKIEDFYYHTKYFKYKLEIKKIF